MWKGSRVRGQKRAGRGKRREKERQKPAEERGDSGAPHSPT